MGTNLRDQNLSAVAGERLAPFPFDTTVSGHRIAFEKNELRVEDGDGQRVLPLSATPDAARELDSELGLDGNPLEQLIRDLSAIRADEFRFEFVNYEDFFR